MTRADSATALRTSLNSRPEGDGSGIGAANPHHPSEPILVPLGGKTYRVWYGWAQSLSFVRAHYVEPGAILRLHSDGRPIAVGIDRFPAYVDERGHLTALQEERLPRCRVCRRRLAGWCLDCHGEGITNAAEVATLTGIPPDTCTPCGGTGRMPPIQGYYQYS